MKPSASKHWTENAQSRHYAQTFVAFLRGHAKNTRRPNCNARDLRDAEAWDRLAATIEREMVRPFVVEAPPPAIPPTFDPDPTS